ncbi:hypothetical protein PP175_04860 [Aneurinibacillus sp. Ricciae_BoGa-3]|uniref:hypothetical protein n=1 Tax=Aneurinibacillus sp. Ricciae_BoGa-3 TaxID=3022697 RepID=UPI002340F64E|nr:hypothetical protein [Aneurinibacillus sp. Ricciae_BoGa-3]WCK55313.1 hypothetical protein PP175_04860 [Aneurinibacillus sp. Ricciae_BoGa-3]
MKSVYIPLKILVSMMLLLLSAACSAKEEPVTESKPAAETRQTTTEPETSDNNKQNSQETTPENKQDRKNTTTKQTAPDKKDSTVSAPSPINKAQTLPKHKDVTLIQEGMKETKQGTLFISPQGYYLYTLPKFTASAEEPGKDIILTSYDERHTMRIELLSKDASLPKLIENAKENLSALGQVNEEKNVSAPFFQTAKAYFFASDNKTTRIIIIQEIAGTLFRFTLTVAHAESAEAMVPSYWAMIKTIGIQK